MGDFSKLAEAERNRTPGEWIPRHAWDEDRKQPRVDYDVFAERVENGFPERVEIITVWETPGQTDENAAFIAACASPVHGVSALLADHARLQTAVTALSSAHDDLLAMRDEARAMVVDLMRTTGTAWDDETPCPAWLRAALKEQS